MKTTKKKGFTLIELIVVIAIIGVLAAILVPTMLGYVRKSKLSSANTTASSVYKAINSALTELDEEGVDIGGDYLLTWSGSAWSDAAAVTTGDKFQKKVENFFADISKVKSAKAQIASGSCIALAAASDSTYTGTYPSGVVTSENYTDTKYKPGTNGVVPDDAINEAIGKAGYEKGSDGKITKKAGTSQPTT